MVDDFETFTYAGQETVNGTSTKKFSLTTVIGGETIEWVRWISLEGQRVQEERRRPGTTMTSTYSGWGGTNIIPGAPDMAQAPSPTTPDPTAEPTLEPTPEPTLEPDPESVTFANGQWRQLAIRGTGLERVNLSINVFNPNGPSRTGAVELDSSGSLPPASDACERTYFSGYSVSVGYTFSLVGLPAQGGHNPVGGPRQHLYAHPRIHRHRERRSVGLEQGARVSAPLLRSAEYSNEKEAWPTTSGPPSMDM